MLWVTVIVNGDEERKGKKNEDDEVGALGYSDGGWEDARRRQWRKRKPRAREVKGKDERE